MLVIKGAKIYTSAGKIYDKGDILIKNGKIEKVVGESIDVPQDSQVYNAEGYVVIPGIVDAHSHIGCFGSTMGEQNANELTNPCTAQLEAIYSIDTSHPDFIKAFKAGITTSVIAPGSHNVIGGLACAVKSYGHSIKDMCVKNPVALKVALGGSAKAIYGARNQAPMTRMAIAQIIRDTFIKAKEYMKKKEDAGNDTNKMPPYDASLENVCRVLSREIPIKVHCQQFDMLTAIRISEEFNIDFTLDHAWGSSDFYNEIACVKNLKGVLYGPINIYLSPGESGKVDIECLSELDKRGVCCSLITDSPVINPDIILAHAGEAVRQGLSVEKAIEMLTINPAKIIGLEDRLGSIEEGKDADIVIFDKTPAVETDSNVKCTIINGQIVYRA